MALEAVQGKQLSPDLVVTDFSMPEFTGLDLARKLAETRNDLPVILMSGYLNSVTPEMLRRASVAGILNNPVETHELSKAVRSALESSRNR